jgi:hypothetical protein
MLPNGRDRAEVIGARKGVSASGWPTYASNRGQLMIQVTISEPNLTEPFLKARNRDKSTWSGGQIEWRHIGMAMLDEEGAEYWSSGPDVKTTSRSSRANSIRHVLSQTLSGFN